MRSFVNAFVIWSVFIQVAPYFNYDPCWLVKLYMDQCDSSGVGISDGKIDNDMPITSQNLTPPSTITDMIINLDNPNYSTKFEESMEHTFPANPLVYDLAAYGSYMEKISAGYFTPY
ncbi:Hypothetical protein CINCED_3A002101 [Cinara cedri]|uniref:Uncharacterized protein n=1 Tax=Cinara cedri TaxID=506608 RepID=A0A5E4N1N2_9HEMI|nr:Hypothetical protein CINCED_3A002101 [Cinara cedri]